MRFGALCKDSRYTRSFPVALLRKPEVTISWRAGRLLQCTFALGRKRKVTPEQRETMNRLCQRIQEEKDSHAFDQLVKELNDLLELTRDHAPGAQTPPDRH